MVLLSRLAFLIHISPASRSACGISSLIFCLFLLLLLFFFLQTLIFRKKCSAAGKGGKDQRDPLLNYFTFGWFLNSM